MDNDLDYFGCIYVPMTEQEQGRTRRREQGLRIRRKDRKEEGLGAVQSQCVATSCVL